MVEWACRNLLYHAQEQLHGFLRNFPNRLAGRRSCACSSSRAAASTPRPATASAAASPRW